MKEDSVKLLRCDSSNKDFQYLVSLLDKWLTKIDGDEHDFYHQFNGIESIKYAIVLYENGNALACGAIKANDNLNVEVKRMYVREESRGRGLASFLLNELELWAAELGFENVILETGRRQEAAVALYQKNNYLEIENFHPYIGVDNSVCFKKKLISKV